MVLTAEQKDAYRRDGFVVYRDILTPEQVRLLRQRTEDIASGRVQVPETEQTSGLPILQKEPALESGTESGVDPLDELRKINYPAFVDPVFREVALGAQILDVIQELLGTPDIYLLSDQIFVKPPLVGSAKEYHQDSGAWPHLYPPNQITCWIALDEATVENGCLRYIRGSHRLGLIWPEHFPQLQSAGLLEDEVPVEVPAGSAVLHHSLTLHYSGPNRSARRRRGWALHYMPAQTRNLHPPGGPPHVAYISVRGRSYPNCV